jgi:hypothetical protein
MSAGPAIAGLYVMRAVTCLSCGAEYGQPHLSTCKFKSLALRVLRAWAS